MSDGEQYARGSNTRGGPAGKTEKLAVAVETFQRKPYCTVQNCRAATSVEFYPKVNKNKRPGAECQELKHREIAIPIDSASKVKTRIRERLLLAVLHFFFTRTKRNDSLR